MSERCPYNDPSGRYIVGRPLGEGATALVCEARDSWTDRDAVLKVSREPGFPEAFRNEAELLPGMVSGVFPELLDLRTGDEEQQGLLVLERKAGTPADGGAEVDPRDLPWIACQLLQGLAELADRGYVHGDLSPANVLLSGTRASLIDLGFSRKPDDGVRRRTGTLISMPPEVLAEGRLHRNSDVFSLGVVLYILLSGHSPWPDDPDEAVSAAMAGRIRPPRLGEEHPFYTRIKSCLAADPEARPSPQELLAELVGELPPDQQALLVPRQPCARPCAPSAQEAIDRLLQGESLLIQGPPGAGKRHAVILARRELLLADRGLFPIELDGRDIFAWAAERYQRHPRLELYPELAEVLRSPQNAEAEKLGTRLRPLNRQLLSFIGEAQPEARLGILLDLGRSSGGSETVESLRDLLAVAGELKLQVAVVADGELPEALRRGESTVLKIPLPGLEYFCRLLESPAPGLRIGRPLLEDLDQLSGGHAGAGLRIFQRNLALGRLVHGEEGWRRGDRELLGEAGWKRADIERRDPAELLLLEELSAMHPGLPPGLFRTLIRDHSHAALDRLQAEGLVRDGGAGLLQVHRELQDLLPADGRAEAHLRILDRLWERGDAAPEYLLHHLAGAGIARCGHRRARRILADAGEVVHPHLQVRLIPELLERTQGSDRLNLLHDLYNALFELGRLEEARKTIRQLLALRDLPASQAIQVLFKLVHSYRSEGRFRLACRLLRAGLRSAETERQRLQLLVQLAESELDGKNADSAQGHLAEALVIYRGMMESGVLDDLSYTINALGGLAFRSGRLAEAGEVWEEMRRRQWDRLGGRQQVWLSNNLGLIHLQEGRLQEARERLSWACEEAGRLHLETAELMARINLATVHTHEGQPELAVRELDRSLPLARSLAQHAYELPILHNRGEAQASLGHLVEAMRDWELEIELALERQQPAEATEPLKEMLLLFFDLDLAPPGALEQRLRELSGSGTDLVAYIEWNLMRSWSRASGAEALQDLTEADEALARAEQAQMNGLAAALNQYHSGELDSEGLLDELLKLPESPQRHRHMLRLLGRIPHSERQAWVEHSFNGQPLSDLLILRRKYLLGEAACAAGDFIQAGEELGGAVKIASELTDHLPDDLLGQLGNSRMIQALVRTAEACREHLLDCA